MITRAAVACLLLLTLTAGGTDAQAQATPPRYEVELVVFAHSDFDPGEELFEVAPTAEPLAAVETLLPTLRAEDFLFATPEPPEATELEAAPEPGEAQTGLPPGGPATPDEPPAEGSQAGDATAMPLPGADLESVIDYRTGRRSLRFRPLRPDELQLGAQRQALERLSAYRPLLHIGWVQEVLSENEAQPFDLALVGSLVPAGSVRVHLSRFLHVTLDLRYHRPGTVEAASAGSFGLGELALAPRYALSTQRRVRSNEVNYFDHPAFGVLIVVRPAPEPAAETPAARPAA